MSVKLSTTLADDRCAIAVVGIACWYPGAGGPKQLWEQILARRREFRRLPKSRTPLTEYFDPDPAVPDKFYQAKAAVIDGFSFDWQNYRIPRSTVESTDISQWLALEVARNALADAGYDRTNVPSEQTGVFIGNTNTGEQMRALGLRLRWPFVRKAFLAGAADTSVSPDELERLVDGFEKAFKAPLPPVTEDFGAGTIGATIAGRICNYFDLHGGTFTIDGACASSLMSCYSACTFLETERLDLALAGGVDITLDPHELVSFSKAGALASQEITPFDRRGAGFVAGEGCGFVVLKRLSDARRAGDYVYAVIRGWGMSADGKGGIMQPTVSGQAAAIRRAYQQAGYDLRSVQFVEAHGTGTKVGDGTELGALSQVLKEVGGNTDRSCGVGSIKSIIGHTKAAAGIAGLIKAVMSVNQRVLPPTASVEEPHALFETTARALYPIVSGEVLEDSAQLRAGVSAFGFGGINAHVTLESGDAPSMKLAPGIEKRALMASSQDTELFIFGGGSISDLLAKLGTFKEEARELSYGNLTDLASHVSREATGDAVVRAAIVCGTPEELAERLGTLIGILQNRGLQEDEVFVSQNNEVFAGRIRNEKRIGFLLPGQGSQQLLTGRWLVERFGWAREMVALADRFVDQVGGKIKPSTALFPPYDRALTRAQVEEWEKTLAETSTAQPAICLTSVLFAKFLERLGIRPAVVLGHSLGELTAFHLAGAFDFEWLIKLAAIRGQAMAAPEGRAGAMASLGCSPGAAEGLMAGIQGELVLANRNSHEQVVVSGDEAAVIECVRRAVDAGKYARRLPVSNAFHSPLVAPAAAVIRSRWTGPRLPEALNCTVVSSVSSAAINVQASTNLLDHFSGQITAPIDFVRAIETARTSADLFLEVGPGKVLTTLANGVLGKASGGTFAMSTRAQSHREMLVALAMAYLYRAPILWKALYENRLVRPYRRPSERIFISSPTERAFPKGQAATDSTKAQNALQGELTRLTGRSPEEVHGYLERRLSFLAAVAKADLLSGAQERSLAGEPRVNRIDQKAPMPTDSSAPAVLDVEALLLDLVAARTGYSRSDLSIEARLLDDLNLDSIKAGELVSSAARRLGVGGKVDPSVFANAKLQDVAKSLRSVLATMPSATAKRPPSMPHPTVPPKTPPTDVTPLLFDWLERRTGYLRSSLSLSARLLDDLNLDSIKAGELVSSLAKQVGVGGTIDATRFANASLAEIVTAITTARGNAAARQQTASLPLVARVAKEAWTIESIESLLVALVSDRTGYPPSSVPLTARVLDDLNLDSIKAGELVAAAAKRVGVAGQIDSSRFANASLQEIVGALHAKVMQDRVEVTPAEPSPAEPLDVSGVIFDILEAISGFSRDALKTSAHVKTDLNLNRGQVDELVLGSLQALGLSRNIDLEPFADKTVGQIIAVIEGIRRRPATSPKLDVGGFHWVRDFAPEMVPEPLVRSLAYPSQRKEDSWEQSDVLILSERPEMDLSEALRRKLASLGAIVHVAEFADARRRGLGKDPRHSHFFAILPRVAPADADDAQKLSGIMERLLSIGAPPTATSVPRRRTTIAYLQFGHGFLGATVTAPDISTCCATGFARSLHLERSDLRVRVIDFSPVTPEEKLVELALAEVNTPEPFMAAGYDTKGERRVPRLTLCDPSTYVPRGIAWTAEDVILVTGGAKGVTAECALGLASQGGPSFALVGRTDPSKGGNEIARTLERFQKLGVRCRYYTCDVSDGVELKVRLQQIREELGPITGIVHGAMVLRPGTVQALTTEGAANEVSPKVRGALNLSREFAGVPVKLFAAFTSIVSHQGMPWSAAYAFSNEALALILRSFKTSHPESAVISSAFGVWGDVGGAVRIGTVEHLSNVGLHVDSITADEGVDRFLRLTQSDPGHDEIVVTTRCTGYDTWSQQRPAERVKVPQRFLEQIMFVEPGVELIARFHVTLERDRYLQNFHFDGMHMLPAVFQQEAVVQAALYLTGESASSVLGFADVAFPWPITIDPEHGTMLEVRVLADETLRNSTRVLSVSLRSEQSGYAQECFTAKVLLGSRRRETHAIEHSLSPLPLDASTYLKESQVFFASLMRMGPIVSIDGDRSIWFSETREGAALGVDGFGQPGGGVMSLGDPYFREALMQTSLLSCPDELMTPKRVERIEFFAGMNAPAGRRLCIARLEKLGSREYRADIVATTEAGEVVERLTGFVGHLHGKTAMHFAPSPEPLSKAAKSSSYGPWVRNFEIGLRISAGKEPLQSCFDASSRVLILDDAPDRERVGTLSARLRGRGAHVVVDGFGTKRVGQSNGERFTHLFAFFGPSPTWSDPSFTLDALTRLISIAAPSGPAYVTYVQFGGGGFDCCSALGFARSLHLERSDLKVRVIDLDPASAPEILAAVIETEVSAEDRFRAVGIDREGVRRVHDVRVQVPARYPKRSLEWTKSDVVLVTGGGKGIAAACALALAKSLDGIFVLVGRSPAPGGAGNDSALMATLKKFEEAGVRHRYCQCDVSDRASVDTLVKMVNAEFGPVHTLVHGATAWHGARARGLAVEIANREIGAKVHGAINLCAALRSQPPKLLIGLTSISMHQGMPWSSVYSFSNDALEYVLRRFGAEHPGTSIQCVSFGVWSKLGASARLQAKDHLAISGFQVDEIPIAEGTRRFVELVQRDSGAQNVLVTGRSRGFDTWTQQRRVSSDSTRQRFIERVLMEEPGVELLARARLTLDKDQYLRDHVYKGMYILPTVFAAELAAQAALRALGLPGRVVRGIRNLKMPWPIVVSPERGEEIEIHALVEEKSDETDVVHVTVRSEETEFKKDYVSATVVLAEARASDRQVVDVPPTALPIWPPSDLYSRQFFVGPMFQRMRDIYSIGPERSICVGEWRAEAAQGLVGFGVGLQGTMALGDPFFRDTLIHSAFLHDLRRARSFTKEIERIDFFKSDAIGPMFCVAVLRASDRTGFEMELTAVSSHGEVLERVRGYRFQVLEEHPEWPSSVELADPAMLLEREEKELSRQLQDATAAVELASPHVALLYKPKLKTRPSDERRSIERPFIVETGRTGLGVGASATLEVTWSQSGQPMLSGDVPADTGVSLSHSDPYCVCVVGSGTQGVDLVRVEARSDSDWLALLGPLGEPLFRELCHLGEPQDIVGARIWGAIEAARKACGAMDLELSIGSRVGNSTLFRIRQPDGSTLPIVTCLVQFARGPVHVVASTARPVDRHFATGRSSSNTSLRIHNDDQIGSLVVEASHSVTWRDCNSTGGTVQPMNYIVWFKDLCDAMVHEEGKRFVAELQTGRVGGVARWTEANFYLAPTAYDEVTCRAWLESRTPTELVWGGDVRLAASGTVAFIRSGAVSLRPNPTGRLVPGDLPEDYGRLYERFQAKHAPGQQLLVQLTGRRTNSKVAYENGFVTTSVDSDLIGNISNLSFLLWVAQTRELCLNEIMKGTGLMAAALQRREVCISQSIRIDYLREVHPNERVIVAMSVDNVERSAATLKYVFARESSGGGSREKVAVAVELVRWASTGVAGALNVLPWPTDLAVALKHLSVLDGTDAILAP